MPDVSLHGRVAPRAKSINVEANLLAERLENRRRLKAFTKRRVAFLVLGIAACCLIVPPAYRLNKASTKGYLALKDKEAEIALKLDGIQQRLDAAQPAQQDQKAVEILHEYAHDFVGQVILVLNKVNPRVALNSFSVQVASNQAKFTAQAYALDYGTASSFVEDLAGKNPSSTLVSDMNSDTTMGASTGVNFNFTHTVPLSPEVH